MKTDEFLALPDEEGVSRELIDGVLREEHDTLRSPRNGLALARISVALLNWLDHQSDIEGVVAAGEARCRLQVEPPVIVGVDVGLFTGSTVTGLLPDARFFDGAPLIAVEVLSSSDTDSYMWDKVRRYLAAGAAQVWVADPDAVTITVHRSMVPPRMYSACQTFDGGDELPVFAELVSALFGRREWQP